MRNAESSELDDLFGWLETRWGMDSYYVLLLNLHKQQYEIGSRTDFEVELSFTEVRFPRSKRLSRVRLIVDRETIKASDVASCRAVISEAFGKPTRNGTSDTLVWRFPTTTVSLWHVLGADGVIAIDFQPSGAFVESPRAF